MRKNLLASLAGFLTGILNGLFGSGGGMVVVPFLKKLGLEQKSAHATSVSIILPLSVLSAGIYISKNYMQINDVFPFLPGGILGAAFGAFLMKKISPKLLQKIFGVFILYCSYKMLFS